MQNIVVWGGGGGGGGVLSKLSDHPGQVGGLIFPPKKTEVHRY